jgi:hypothetical protein
VHMCWLRLTIPRVAAAAAAQVEMICAALSADSKLAGGINVMGVSQVSSTCASRPTHTHTHHIRGPLIYTCVGRRPAAGLSRALQQPACQELHLVGGPHDGRLRRSRGSSFLASPPCQEILCYTIVLKHLHILTYSYICSYILIYMLAMFVVIAGGTLGVSQRDA